RPAGHARRLPNGNNQSVRRTIGSKTRDGYSVEWSTVWWAICIWVALAIGSPVFRLRSKRGKLLLLTSSLMRWPPRNTLLVTPRSTVSSYTPPEAINWGRSHELRYLQRRIPSHRFIA